MSFLTILTLTVSCLPNLTRRVHSSNQSSQAIEIWFKQQLAAREELTCMVRRPRSQQKEATQMRTQMSSYKSGLERRNLRQERTRPALKPSNSCKLSNSKRLLNSSKRHLTRSCFQTSTVLLTTRSEARSDKELMLSSELECTRS